MTLNVLMLIAHPDDEILFGYYDVYYSNCTIICFTNGKHKIRSIEFKNSMLSNKFIGHMYDLHDSMTDNWLQLTDEAIYQQYVIPVLLNHKYDMIVSHDVIGEYGHIQHKRVHQIAIYCSHIMNIPFMDFYQRYQLTDLSNMEYINQRNAMLSIYASQKISIDLFRSYYDKKLKD